MKLGIGIYGKNGHQVIGHLIDHPHAQLIAAAGIPEEDLPPAFRGGKVKIVPRLDDLLAMDEVELVSLCSPVRRYQAADAIRCLQAGKDVYAEKPAAMVEADLDAILSTAQSTGQRFHEMAGTATAQPYWAMRKVVQSGVIGEVVQIIAQKSYPYYDARPQDEDRDGGLLCQATIHAVRFVEHVGCVRIDKVTGLDTRTANPVAGGNLRMAAALMMTLANGGLAVCTSNYLNQKGTGIWGYESLKIFGTKGIVESWDGGRQHRLVVGEKDHGPLDVSEESVNYFDHVVASIQGRAPMPWSLEEELHGLRIVLRAKMAADTSPGTLL
jgi:predicted dehydrogenase